MSYFEKLINRIFPEKSPPGTVVVHEVLKRTEKETQRYESWKNTDAQSELLQTVAQAYYYKKTNIRTSLDVHLFNTVYANGFAITYPPAVSAQVFKNLFDYLKDRVLLMSYRLVTADRRIIDRENYVETIEKYYLKPPLKAQKGPLQSIDQQYGNIVIEYILIDGKPSYIKLLASIYSDSLYKEALSHNELMKKLFEDITV